MEEPKKPTPEEIAQYELEMSKFYEEKLPFLRLKAEYDTLSADIAEARVRIPQANHMYIKMKLDELDAKAEVEEQRKKTEDVSDKG